jgi:hypothetical protein
LPAEKLRRPSSFNAPKRSAAICFLLFRTCSLHIHGTPEKRVNGGAAIDLSGEKKRRGNVAGL